jgi:hypothetical protein
MIIANEDRSRLHVISEPHEHRHAERPFRIQQKPENGYEIKVAGHSVCILRYVSSNYLS